jgi:hypothetical protein
MNQERLWNNKAAFKASLWSDSVIGGEYTGAVSRMVMTDLPLD